MSTQQIKVIYKNETKKFKKPTEYEALHTQTLKAFGATLPKNFKFFYQDPEGDLISISCQEDLEEAYSSMTQLRLFVEASIQEARNLLEPDFSMRSSSLNMPLQMSSHASGGILGGPQNILTQAQFQHTFDSLPSVIRPSNGGMQQIPSGARDFSQEFEDVGSNYQHNVSRPQMNFQNVHQQSSHSIAIGGDDNEDLVEASTDVNNLVNLQNFGCNTNNVATDEKQLNAVVDTKDCGFQIQKEVREVQCDGSIQTESKGSQFRTEAVS